MPFDPLELFALSRDAPQIYEYVPGYSKRTLLGGSVPVADIGVWNPKYGAGYEITALLPPGETSEPIARLRYSVAGGFGGLGKRSMRRDWILCRLGSRTTATRMLRSIGMPPPKPSLQPSPASGSTGTDSTMRKCKSIYRTNGCAMLPRQVSP